MTTVEPRSSNKSRLARLGLAEPDFHRLLTRARFTIHSVTRMAGGHNVFECAL